VANPAAGHGPVSYCGETTIEEVGVIGSIDVELVTVPPSPSGSGDIDHELATISGLSTVEEVAVGEAVVSMAESTSAVSTGAMLTEI